MPSLQGAQGGVHVLVEGGRRAERVGSNRDPCPRCRLGYGVRPSVQSRLLIVTACLALAGCWSRDTAAPGALEPLKLADTVAAAMGRPTHMEIVAGVIRPTLPGVHTDWMLPAERRATVTRDAGGFEVSFPCSEVLTGRPAVFIVMLGGDATLVRPFGCPSSPDTPARVRLPGDADPSNKGWLVQGLEQAKIETPHIELRHGARLRVALGISPLPALTHGLALALRTGDRGSARFRIAAENGAGQTATVLDRRLDPSARAEDSAWVSVDLDLEPVRRALGPDVRLRFEAEADDATTFPVWGDPTVVWPPTDRSTTPPRRNVVLVSLDTLRADRLGMYGARRPTSPTLDALAARSTVFETVIAPAPWTLPSTTSMMTGLHECVHGMTGTIGKSFPPGLVPLAQRLRDRGYATAAVTEDAFVDAAAFTRGFGYYRDNRTTGGQVSETVARALEWLRSEATEPFFLFVHTYQTHDPYFAAPPFAGMFASDAAANGAPGADAAKLATYDAAVRYTDAAIVPLLDAVTGGERGERTVLAITSDHGEAFGEHGYTGHGRTLHEEVLRVPLLVWGPGLVAPGRRVPGLVGVIDVTPTILDVLGLPVPPDLTGVSLAPQLRAGAEPPPVPARALFSENSLHGIQRLAIRWPDWKATWEGAGLTIVDLARDPTEHTVDGTGPRTTEAAAVRARFEAECERLRTLLETAGAAQTVPVPDPHRERQLKALGYVE